MSHEIPRTTLDSLKEVLAGYNKIAEPGEKITDEGVGEVRDISADNARRQKKFLDGIGVLKKDGHDYLLTEAGHELGKQIRFNKDDEAAEIFEELLDDWEPKAEILSYVDDDGIGREELANNVALVTATELSDRRRELGAETVIDLFEWASFIKKEDDGMYRMVESTDDGQELEHKEAETTVEEKSEAPSEEPEISESSEPIATSTISGNGDSARPETSVDTGGIDISLDVSGDDDPENIRDLLLAIRQGTQEEVDEFDIGKASD